MIGAIDGCHIEIRRPHVRGIDYMNRKGFYSILLQGIVDEHGRFIDVFVGPPSQSSWLQNVEGFSFSYKWGDRMERHQLLGVTAYIGSMYPFIFTPKRDNGTLSPEEECYNTRLSQGRMVVKYAFGHLKCQWRRIKEIQNTRQDVVVQEILAACVLHKFSSGPITGVCEDHPLGCTRDGDENE